MKPSDHSGDNKKPQESRAVQDEHGTVYQATTKLSAGGQGSVWQTGFPNVLVKVSKFRRDHPQSAQWFEQVQRVKRLPLDGLKVARPQAMIVKPRHGYVMELMDGLEPLQTLLEAPIADGSLRTFIRTGGLSRRLRLLSALAGTLADLHGRGLAYGDLSPGNIFVSRSVEHSEVWLIDCDNITVLSRADSPPIYTPEYGAPEIVRGMSGIDSLTDAWSFAVIAFQLLTLQHPLKGDLVNDGDEDEEQRAMRGELPWIDDPDDERNRASSGMYREWVLTSALVDLFQRCFGPGRDNPQARPEMSEWRAACELALSALVSCGGSDCGSGFYLNDRRQCSFCDHVESSDRHVLLWHWMHTPVDEEDIAIGMNALFRTDRFQVLNEDPVQLRSSPPGTAAYGQSEPMCTLTLSAEGLRIDPAPGMTVFLQTSRNRSLRQLKRREWFRSANRNGEVCMLHLGNTDTRHVWRFKW
ncbi:protein kinase domain-containing protein [Caballeronia glebae]|uniref:protein kinase domain-containing protein n=1 Tax=Caballeronia glebae TaxID=1777143 RepID=UPI0038B7F310